NVTYPLIPEEVTDFCRGKKAVLIIEEGQPEFIEHELNTLIRRAGLETRIVGKGPLPRAGEYGAHVIQKGLKSFLEEWSPKHAPAPAPVSAAPAPAAVTSLAAEVPARPARFCTGCRSQGLRVGHRGRYTWAWRA